MIERWWNKWPMDRIEATPQSGRGGYNKARERNRLLRQDASVVQTGAVVLKYLQPEEARKMLKTILAFATNQELEWLMNTLCGGEHPKFDIDNNLANKFCIREVPEEDPPFTD
jgi:hypothetical protein